MQTLIVVKVPAILDSETLNKYRKDIMKQMEEGLLILDEKVEEIIVNNINGELGLEFNKEENDEKESI